MFKKELINRENLHSMLFGNALQAHPYMTTRQSYLDECLQKLAKVCTNSFDVGKGYSAIPTHYKDYGDRRYAEGVTLQTIDGTLRNLLVADFCYDADIVNSCPSILLSIMRNHKVKAPCLKKYCTNRKQILKDLIASMADLLPAPIDRSVAKNAFTVITFGGSINTWIKAHDLQACLEDVINAFPFLLEYAQEMKKLQNLVWSKADRFDCTEIKAKLEKDDNQKPKLLSRLAFREERKIIDILMREIESDGLCINSIIHDGVLVYDPATFTKSPELEGRLCDTLKKSMKCASKELGYQVEIILKPMETFGVQLDDHRIDRRFLDQFDMRFMANLKSYPIMKAYFELFFGFIIGSDEYAEVSKTFSMSHDKQAMISRLAGLKVQCTKKGKDGDSVVMKDFFTVYSSDINRKQYHKTGIYFDEDLTKAYDDNAFNINIPLPDVPEKPELYDTCISHFERLVGHAIGDPTGSLGYVNYFNQWLADMIQNPTKKQTSVSMIITGHQGTGKSSISEIMTWIFGVDRVLTESSGRCLRDEFNGYLMGKYLFNLEESEQKEDLTGRIKHFTTASEWHYEFKNKNKFTARLITRLLFVSNKKVPVFIDANTGERRFCVFNSCDVTDELKHFFDRFYKAYGVGNKFHEQFKQSVYHYLSTMNVTISNFQKQRPLTEAYRRMMLRCVNKKIQFMIDFIERCGFDEQQFLGGETEYWKSPLYGKKFTIPKHDLFQAFSYYHEEEYNMKMKLNKSEFYNDIEQHFGIKSARTKNTLVFSFTPSKIMKIAKKNNWLMSYHGEPITMKVMDDDDEIPEDQLLDF